MNESEKEEVHIEEDKGNLLAFLMSIITLITGIMAAINQMLAMRAEDEVDDDELETFARELDEVEARLDEHEAQLDVLQEDHNPVR